MIIYKILRPPKFLIYVMEEIKFTLGDYTRLKNQEGADPRILCGHRYLNIISTDGVGARDCSFPILCDNGEYYSRNGKPYLRNGQRLMIRYRPENPLKSGRYVSDMTFAVRLMSFLKGVKVEDFISQEEKNYLLDVSEKLLKWQEETVTDENEKTYLGRIKEGL